MSIHPTILAISVLLQLVAAGLALRVGFLTRRRVAWALIALAIVLMASRRIVSLAGAVGDPATGIDLVAEGIALAISACLVLGLWALSPDLRSLRGSQQRESRLGTILEDSLNEIFLFDARTLRFLLVNRGARENLGYGMDELRNMTPVDLKPEFDERSFADLLEPLRRGRTDVLRFSTTHRRKDGSTYPVEVNIQASLSAEPPAFVAIIQDVTREAELQRELLQAQRMEALGQLAGGIAHDFNNLLTVIAGHAELLALRPGRDPEATTDVDAIARAAERAALLTSQLLTFSRRPEDSPRPSDVGACLREMEGLLRRLIEEDIEVEVRPGPVGAWVEVSPEKLEQVVLNLAINARDAMPDGGRLTIEARAESGAPPDEPPRPGARPGGHVVLEVSDTGHGMDEETRLHAFEPFFTTKEPGKGTGLGLATVYGIVTGAGGAMRVESSPGRGARFAVSLPRTAAPTDPAGPVESAPDAREADGTILLVEDDPAVRTLAVRILRAHGHDVVPARDGVEAIQRAEEGVDRYRLLISDWVMPGLSGPDLVTRIRERIPGIRVVLMSGHAGRGAGTPPAALPVHGFLKKPFSSSELLAATRAALLDGRGT